jgi:hypothetical protein
MAFTKLPDYPGQIGGKLLIEGDWTGPANYLGVEVIGQVNNMTGQTIAGLGSIDQVLGSGSFSVSGAYQVFAQPSGAGPRKTWNLFWNGTGGVATVVQNAAGTGMTPGVYTSSAATGGAGAGATPAQIQVTVLTATTIGPIVVLNPGRGYTTLPTGFTVVTGGTAPTFTITGSVLGPVASGVNLSAEIVRLGILGR